MNEIRIQGSERTFRPEAGETLLRSALRAGIPWPYECSTGGCGTCKFELLDGAVTTLRDDAPGLSDRDRRKNRHLACQCRVDGSCEVKLRVDPDEAVRIRPDRLPATLTGYRDITHDIREFVLVTGRPAEFLPGQYALLGFGDAQGTIRAYSMSNLPNAEGHWHFQVRRVPGGRGSGLLFDLGVGDSVTMDGPYGHAWLREQPPRDLVCVAGGSGLAPMISIARAHAQSEPLRGRRLDFFYGGRQPRDICGEDMLRELPGFGDTVRFHPVVSELPSPGDASVDAWRGTVGWVHEAIGTVLPEPLDRYEYYFAGPPPMAAALLDLLQVRHRVGITQIHFDRFF